MQSELAASSCSLPLAGTYSQHTPANLQVEDNLAALAVMPKLTPELLARIDGIVGGAYD